MGSSMNRLIETAGGSFYPQINADGRRFFLVEGGGDARRGVDGVDIVDLVDEKLLRDVFLRRFAIAIRAERL